jgi:formylglycine-generating enzyme required for sulfatase activity
MKNGILNLFRKSLCIYIVSHIFGCNSINGPTNQQYIPLQILSLQHKDGMVLIPSKNNSFSIADTVLDSVKTTLTYDYWIDTSEITQKEFNYIIKKQYPWFKIHTMFLKYSIDSIGDSFPIFGISWNHAVLFCNEKSKYFGFDTAYSYTNLRLDTTWFDTFSTPIIRFSLLGIKTYFNANGFRLPTEAEWVFACKGNSSTAYYWGTDTSLAQYYSWTGYNRNRAINKVCMKYPNQFGIYDMIGNLREYCNDFYSAFSTRELVDPKGGIDSTWIVLKGGTYRNGISQCGISMRYKTNRESASNFEGFRTVRKY